jgi:chloramphenicol O-acetyltransferase type A
MRQINLETWPRREHFEVFNTFDYPHFSLCANIDLTAFCAFIKRRDISFNVAAVYTIARAANAIPEFRYRVRAGTVIEHDVVHPSSTIMGKDDVFSFCAMEYVEDFSKFAAKASEKIARVQKRPRLTEEDQNRDDWLFMTAIPWVTFTSFMHPLHFHPVDSVPRFAWGKFFEDGDSLKMPLSVQGHHAVMDGLHAGRFYAEVQDYFQRPEIFLGEYVQ